MTQLPHVIGKQILDLAFEGTPDALTLQHEVGEVFQTRVLPAMGAVLDRYTDSRTVVRIDRIELDIGRLEPNQLASELAAKVCEALEIELAALLSVPASEAASPRSERLTVDAHPLDVWHHVIAYGYLPWWAPPAAAEDLEVRVIAALEARHMLPEETIQLFEAHPTAVRRLARQSSTALLDRLLLLADRAFAAAALPLIGTLGRLLEAHPVAPVTTETLRRSLWEVALTEGLHPAQRATDAKLRRFLRLSLQMAVQEAAVTYGELLSHILAWVQPPGAAAGVPPPEETAAQRSLAAVVKDLNVSDALPQRTAASGASSEGVQTADVGGGEMPAPDRKPGGEPSTAQDRGQADDALPTQDRLPGRPPGRPMDASGRVDGHVTAPAVASAAGVGGTARPPGDEGIPEAAGTVSGVDDAGPEAGPPQGGQAVSGDTLRPDQAPPDPLFRPGPAAAGPPGETAPGMEASRDHLAEGAKPAIGDGSPRGWTLPTGERLPEMGTRQKPPAPKIREGEIIYVDDAGAVLLHPFLKTHFEKLDLWRDDGFVDEAAHERAVHQVRFLATGETDAHEYSLVVAKILCGLPPDAPIGRAAPFEQRAKLECDALLEAVIQHWAALKSTSPDGLREAFLRREGRLTRRQDGWRLKVAPQSYDLLLDRLPWSLSIIRLPWMSELLWVDWT